jgi:hypothetical protein
MEHSVRLNMENNRNDGQEELPRGGEAVFVEHNGRTQYAYRDADGKWRDYYKGDVLEGEVRFTGKKP